MIKGIKRIMIAVVGGTVLAIGVALVVLPGPAFIVIPVGLMILAVEFAWAGRWLRSARTLLTPRRQRHPSLQKPTVKSAWRRVGFLFRRARQSLFPKRKTT